MNFTPFHAFAGCRALEARMKLLRAAGSVPEAIVTAHDLYHYSLLHKLRSAKYHVETLQNYLATQNPSKTPPEDIIYRVNFHFDGYLHVLGSAMDIFAREVLTYFGEALPQKVYFHTAHEILAAKRPGDAILNLLAKPAWKQEFSDYRNTATHESLIGSGFSIEVTMQGGVTTQRLNFPIPDDPRAATKTFQRNKDIVEYCERTFKRVLSLFNQGYNQMATRAATAGTLPL